MGPAVEIEQEMRSMAYDEGLAERIRVAVDQRPGVTERKMFGGLAFMIHGHMFCGVLQESLMARVGPDAYAGALARSHTREMDFTGRPMKGYVYVDPEGIEEDDELQAWVDRCVAFALSLPPREK
jgi:hypothetical protein